MEFPSRKISATGVAGENRSDGGSVARKASDAVFSLGAGAPQVFASAQANFADLMRRQPLMLGALGLAVGAGVAASLRTTEAEVDLVGQAAAKAKERARELAAAAARRANDVSTAIAEEASAQKLTPDGIRQAAGEASRRVETVIDRSAERLRTRMN